MNKSIHKILGSLVVAERGPNDLDESHHYQSIEYDIFDKVLPGRFANEDDFEEFKKELLAKTEEHIKFLSDSNEKRSSFIQFLIDDNLIVLILYLISHLITFFLIFRFIKINPILGFEIANLALKLIVSYFLFVISITLKDYFLEKLKIMQTPSVKIVSRMVVTFKKYYTFGVTFFIVFLFFASIFSMKKPDSNIEKFTELVCRKENENLNFLILSDLKLSTDKKYQILTLKEVKN